MGTISTTPDADEAAGWVERARRGDRAAFDWIIERYQRRIYALAYHMLADRDEAADVAQDCFVSAYRAIGRTRGELRLEAWLCRIAANRCLDLLRRRGRLRWVRWDGARHDHLLPAGAEDDPARAAERAETRAEAAAETRRILARMTPRLRLALLLRETEELDYAAIATAMGLSRLAVKATLWRAREEFRRLRAAGP
jgi:RNA polymerase sigma-70 factor (ECF subfamily)